MTKTLSDVQRNSASVESMLKAAGAHLWRAEDLEKYRQEEYMRQQTLLWRLLNRLHPRIPRLATPTLCLTFIVSMVMALLPSAAAVNWAASAVAVISGTLFYAIGMHTGLAWRRLPIESALFIRDAVAMPREAHEMMRNIGAVLPQSKFEVEYLGKDPILWAVPRPRSWPRLSYPVLVWDANRTVVLPPE